MYAKKANKVYKVDDISKKSYLAQGYDIYDDKGKMTEPSPKSTVPYAEYEKLQKENEELKKQLSKSDNKASKKSTDNNEEKSNEE